MKKKIAIGICTLKRTTKLKRCLDSINNTDKPADVDLSIIITDNDTNGSARSIVKEIADSSDTSIYYDIEFERGVSSARNNILKRAISLNISELIFIDDDEYVSKDWLKILLDYYTTTGADVVRGPVVTVYPERTPKWIVEGNFYQRERHKTGSTFEWANTGNVFFNFKKLVIEWGLSFDPSYNSSGGEDLAFFYQAYKYGAIIVWTDRAVVYETLDEKCFKVSYLAKRRFKENNNKIFFENFSSKQKLIMVPGVFKRFLTDLFCMLFVVFGSKTSRAKRVEKVAISAGFLAGTIGLFCQKKHKIFVNTK